MEAFGRPKRRVRVYKSCTECQRRKQKCIFRSQGTPCVNCSRRYPPVECVTARSEFVVPEQQFAELVWSFDDEPEPSTSGVLVPAACLPERAARILPLPRPANSTRSIIKFTTHGSTKARRRADDPEEDFPDRGVSRSLYLDGLGDPDALVHVRPFGGILTEVSSLKSLSIEQSMRNTELLHFYIRVVAPNLVSIDGQSQPAVFLTAVLPWMLQSPLFPSIGMLMASTTQSLERGIEVVKNPESLALKSRVLEGVNGFLRGEFSGEDAKEVIKSVINLVVMEWFWGTDDSMWAHLRGVKHMIKLRQGMRGVQDLVGESILILTDYEIACCFESELFLQADDPVLEEEIPIPLTWPEGFDCPLIPSETSFAARRTALELTARAAQILDDVRFLVTSVTQGEESETKAPKARSTAAWLHRRLRDMPMARLSSSTPEEECVQEAIRLAALVHSWSVSTLSQISAFKDATLLERAAAAVRSVSLTRWKRTPGIFLWVMLVAAPNTRQDVSGRFVRRKMAVTGLSIGFEDFLVGISYLRAFWLVQRWIAREGEREQKKREARGHLTPAVG